MTNNNDLWNHLTASERAEFTALHLGDNPEDEDRLDELLEIARERSQN